MSRYVFVFICSLYSLLTAGQTQFQYKLRKGDHFSIEQQSVQETVRLPETASENIRTEVCAILDFEVLAEYQRGYEIGVSYKDLKMNIYSDVEEELLQGKRDTEVTTDLYSGIIVAMAVMDCSEGCTLIPRWGSGKITTAIRATTTYKRI